MLFSSGMPILSIFEAVFGFLTYWTDKYVVLKTFQGTADLRQRIGQAGCNHLACGGADARILGIGVLEHACTFPSKPLGSSLQSLASKAPSAASGMSGKNVSGNSLLKRAMRESTEPVRPHDGALQSEI